jgi:hypothetical protein
MAAVALSLAAVAGVQAQAPQAGRLGSAMSIRCTFPRMTVGAWNTAGAAEASARSSSLTLRFESIDIDQGTASLRTGSQGSDVIVRLEGGYMHFMQSFRTGPLYTTTVFDLDGGSGKLKAVHSRHEYFAVPLPGSTSSPEQYYGECEIVSGGAATAPAPRTSR